MIYYLKFVLDEGYGISLSNVDEKEELEKYKEEVLGKAKENNMSEEDIAYVEEDLRSTCTQEIAVFRAFAEIVERSENEFVVIDTAPTGHTLLLLESTESYNREIVRLDYYPTTPMHEFCGGINNNTKDIRIKKYTKC